MMKVPGLQVGRIKWMTLMILDGRDPGMDFLVKINLTLNKKYFIKYLMIKIIYLETLILPIQLILTVKVPAFLQESEYWSGNRS